MKPAGFREHRPRAGVVHWTLCDEARRNPVGIGTLRFIEQRCATLRGEVVVLRGTGGESFCSGFDLNELRTIVRDPSSPPDESLIAATAAMVAADATFVAVLGGYAIGAGVELACACDLRIARAGITFSVPAGRLGVVYHAAGLARMRVVFGLAATQRMVLLGESLTAEEAFAVGAVLAVASPPQLAAEVERVVATLRAATPAATQGNRDLLRALAGGGLDPTAKAVHDQRRERAYAAVRVGQRGDPDGAQNSR